MEDADIVIIAPKILGAHSTKETVYIPSIEKVYNYEKTIAKDNCFAGIAGLHSYTNNEITGNYNKKEYNKNTFWG